MTVDSPGATSTHRDDVDPATQPLRPDASVTELLGELAGQMSTLFRQELELAKVETKEEAKRAGRAAAMFAGAGTAALIGLLLASMAIAWLLDQGLNTALSFAIVAVVWFIVAVVLLMRGRRTAADVQPLPTTTATLKEDVEWAKAQKH
jgi:uncharacterized membrane protein YqjE